MGGVESCNGSETQEQDAALLAWGDKVEKWREENPPDDVERLVREFKKRSGDEVEVS